MRPFIRLLLCSLAAACGGTIAGETNNNDADGSAPTEICPSDLTKPCDRPSCTMATAKCAAVAADTCSCDASKKWVCTSSVCPHPTPVDCSTSDRPGGACSQAGKVCQLQTSCGIPACTCTGGLWQCPSCVADAGAGDR